MAIELSEAIPYITGTMGWAPQSFDTFIVKEWTDLVLVVFVFLAAVVDGWLAGWLLRDGEKVSYVTLITARLIVETTWTYMDIYLIQ